MSFPVFFLPATARALCVHAVCAAALLALAGSASAAAPFVDNGDGTVTDTSTGLMWDQCTLGLSGAACASGTATTHSWFDAHGQAATQSSANYKGYSDWRLPSMVELLTLLKSRDFSPAIDSEVFPNTFESFYWSGSTNATYPANAWLVDFWGDYGHGQKAYNTYVRLVRSGQYFGYFGLFPVLVSGATATAATLTATSSIAATGHWLVVPRNALPPTVAQIIAGANYATVTVVANGSGAMTAKTPATLALAGLAAGTDYDLYMVAKESDYETTSNVSGPVSFSTVAISTSSIVIDPVTPTTLYSGLDGAGVYKSTGSGANWTAATTQPTNTRVKALVIQPGDSAVLYAGTYGGGAFKSTDSGANWGACATQPANLNLLSLTMDASGKLYAGSEAGVFVSSDGCATWTARNAGLPI